MPDQSKACMATLFAAHLDAERRPLAANVSRRPTAFVNSSASEVVLIFYCGTAALQRMKTDRAYSFPQYSPTIVV
jgi:hypothetical protein